MQYCQNTLVSNLSDLAVGKKGRELTYFYEAILQSSARQRVL